MDIVFGDQSGPYICANIKSVLQPYKYHKQAILYNHVSLLFHFIF